MALSVTSSAFERGEKIPPKYTADGDNVSPPLQWEGVPEGTKSLALICDDPDAPGTVFVHWVLYGLPPDINGLDEDMPPKETLPNGARQGKNSFGDIGYGGPAPPPGSPHRYQFKLYALDATIDLGPGATKEDLLKIIEEHIIVEGEYMGLYER